MTAPGDATVHRARWVVPGGGPAVPDGAVVSLGGRIARIGPWARVRPHVGPAEAVCEWPESAILPGFVNAHTHLGLSDMAGRFRPTANFLGWIGRLTARVMMRSEAAGLAALAEGVARSARAGTAGGADLTRQPHLHANLDRPPGRWTVFAECFRFGDAGLASLAEAVRGAETAAGVRGVRPGLSPHAPYTVGLEVFRAARREADARGWPVATHLHETEDELAFTERGEGRFHAWMRGLGLLPRSWRPAGRRPIRALADVGFFAGPVLVGHANYLRDEEIAILAESGSSVAYCPRSHAFFGHRDHPWRRLAAAGVNVCLGTDSLASCPDLSMLAEARFLAAREPGVAAAEFLAMITSRAARAVGRDDELGALAPGKAADLAIVGPVPADGDPLEAVFRGGAEVAAAVRGGEIVESAKSEPRAAR